MNLLQKENRGFIMIGAGGHAKVLMSILSQLKMNILGVCDPIFQQSELKFWRGIPIFSENEITDQFNFQSVLLVNGVGQRVNDFSRQDVFLRYKKLGYEFATLVHPTAWVDPSVHLKEGVQIMAGSVIQADVTINENVIVNTLSSVDHDCQISSHVHLAPGSVLCGMVRVGQGSFIGAGAVLAPSVRIGKSVIIGAGASIVRDVVDAHQVLPAKVKKIEMI